MKYFASEQVHPTLSQNVTESLIRRILSGTYPTGTRLPTERALAEEFRVARHVIREALKRLEAIGLLRIRQGSGIYAQQMHFSAGVDFFDILLTNEDGSVNYDFLQDVLEFRAHTVRAIVQVALEKHTPEDLENMRRIWQTLLTAPQGDEQDRLRDAFYESIARSTHNQIYIRLYYTLGRIFMKLRELYDVPLVGADQGQQIVEMVFDIFERRDLHAADTLIMSYMQVVNAAFRAALQPADPGVGRAKGWVDGQGK